VRRRPLEAELRRTLDPPAVGPALLALAFCLSLGCGDEAPPLGPDASAVASDLGSADAGAGPDARRLDIGDFPTAPDAAAPPPPGIFDIQQGLVPVGRRVALQGVVSAPGAEGFFLSEIEPRPFGGLFVVTPTTAPVALGDRVTVTGRVAERPFVDTSSRSLGTRTELRVLDLADVTVTATGAPPAPLAVTLPELTLPELTEPYEGVVVELSQATLTALDVETGAAVLDHLVPVDARALRLDPAWVHQGARFEHVAGAVQLDERGFHLIPRGPRDAPRAAPAAGGCLPLGDHLLCLDRASWDDARVGCAARGGRLALLETRTENATVSARVREHTGRVFWIAATDRAEEGRFLWVDGSPLAYEAWGRGEPNDAGPGEDCAQGNFRNLGEWNDGRCRGPQTYVCEFAAEAPRCAADADCGEGASCQGGRCRRP
jgi:hypothetical protein